MEILKIVILNSFLLFTISTASFAEGIKDGVINRVIEAYGGESFTNMKSLVISNRYKGFRFGQSNRPDAVDEELYDARITIDFDKGRKSFQWVTGRPSSFGIQHQIFDGDKGFRLDHTNRTIAENNAINFARADRQISYFVDTVLLKLLITARDSAVYLGKENYRGKPHDKISFQASGHPELMLYINEKTSRISKMTRPHWSQGQFSYQFNDHKLVDGVLVAQDTYVTRGGQPFNVMLSREISVNSSIENEFNLPVNYTQQGDALDFAEMSVTELADKVFLAGQGWGFSIFVDVGDHFVAMGGYEDLKKRFEAVKSFSRLNKPLKFQIVSHHHSDHLGGMKEAAELGVTFVTVKEHVASIREVANLDIPDNRFKLINGSGDIANGKVRIVDFPNGHSANHLIAYISDAKIAFTADMFFSRQKSGSPAGYEGLIDFRKALVSAGFDTSRIAAAHSGRVLTDTDLDQAIANIKPEICPQEWSQCTGFAPE